MKLYLCLLFAYVVWARAANLDNGVDVENIEREILDRLITPNDSVLEKDAKVLIAQFLTETVIEANDDVVFYRRDKERNRTRVRDKNKPHKPHTDYRLPISQQQVQASPVVANQAQVVPAVNPVAQPIAAVDANSQARQDVSTQIPILTQPPVGVTSVPGSLPVTAVPAISVQTFQPAVTNPVVTIPTLPPITRPTVSPEHVYNQVDKILGSVATGNIVGIVDESLAIRAPVPVRNFVTGIMKVIFCNPLDRLFGRCRPNSSGAISSVQGG